MNVDWETTQIQAELPPLVMLLLAYARPRQRDWQRLCWLLDQRLAAVIRRGGEPTIAAIRLAWWDAVLVDDDRSKGGGEPLVEAWRATAPSGAAALAGQLIDGWRTLLGGEALTTEELGHFAEQRGGGLFGLIAAGAGEGKETGAALIQAGALWALWDLAGNASDAERTAAAMEQAAKRAAAGAVLPRALAPRPLRLLHDLARADARAGRMPKAGFEGRHYRRLLWRSLLA